MVHKYIKFYIRFSQSPAKKNFNLHVNYFIPATGLIHNQSNQSS
jgi:hypothetical protein